MSREDKWARRLLGLACLLLAASLAILAVMLVRGRCAHVAEGRCMTVLRAGPDAVVPFAMARFTEVAGREAEPVAAETPADAVPAARPTVAYPPLLQYPLSSWNAIDFRGGFIDRAALLPGGGPVDRAAARLPRGTALELSGWAGHSSYGMRSRTVLFAACGRVVGHAATGEARPDVGRSVHPNLAQSGWTATLAVDALPTCDKPVLSAWAVAPVGRNIFPLAGGLAISLAPRGPDPGPDYATGPATYRPADNPPAEPVSLRARKGEAPLRRCGSVSCDLVSRLPATPTPGFIIERHDGWALVQAGEKAGWVAERDIRTD